MQRKNEVLNLIINFVKAINEGTFKDNNYQINSPRYLLNQILRQIQLPESNYFISERAKQKWLELSKENIKNYYYQKHVLCENNNPVIVKCFKSNSNNFAKKELVNGNKFVYKDVFHDEHMIPIDIIIKKLCEFYLSGQLNYNNVEQTINNIYICKMLKEEDRNIKIKYNRPFELDKVIQNIYLPAGIKIEKL